MTTMALFGRNYADLGVISGGSFYPQTPASRMQSIRLRDVARTTDLSPASTQFKNVFPETVEILAHFVGPMNATAAMEYRMRTYADAAGTDLVSDSGRIPAFPTLNYQEVDWEQFDFWRGLSTGNNRERRPWLHHFHDTPVRIRSMHLELFDEANPAGYLEIGRLFQAGYFRPSINYSAEGNGLSLENAARSAESISGVPYHKRRQNPRIFEFGWDTLSDKEALGRLFDFFEEMGFDREVFVVPDPGGIFHQSRSFMGHFVRIDPIRQTHGGWANTGAAIREKIG